MLINILLLTILISFVTMGARIITQKQHFAHPVRTLGLKIGWITKPIITCCVCMPSLWGIGIYFFIMWVDPTIQLNIYFLPLVILSSSFLNGLLWVIYVYIERKVL